jgi:uncharacterized protein (DUF2336 family)
MPGPFASLEGLMRLSRNEGIDVRTPLLRVLTDLYVQEPAHTREEEQQYVELALRLLPDVDAATRSVVARKLKAYPQAPVAVLDAIVQAMPEIVIAPLAGSPEKPAGADRGDAAASPDSPVEPLHPVAPADAGLADRAGSISLGEAFLQMTAAERAKLLQGLDQTDRPDEDSDDAFSLPPRAGARKRLERAALQRNNSEFARELSLSLGISPRVANRIAHDDSGELIVVATKALDMRIDMLVRILLILNPAIGESVERVFTLYSLYERLLPETVAPIVTGWREEAASRASVRFQSVHADDGKDAVGSVRELPRAAEEAARRTTPAPGIAPRRQTSGG